MKAELKQGYVLNIGPRKCKSQRGTEGHNFSSVKTGKKIEFGAKSTN